jgi:hypothetical protein
VKLVDFGVAKASTVMSETREGTVKGKYGYMSPEQCLGAPLDRRSDLFAVGILLWEMTVGRRLYKIQGELATLQRVVYVDAPRPSRYVADVPPELERIIMRALARDPAQRYATAQQLQIDLEQFALDQRLALSAVAMSREMHELFKDHLDAWREAEQRGRSLAEHLAELSPEDSLSSEELDGVIGDLHTNVFTPDAAVQAPPEVAAPSASVQLPTAVSSSPAGPFAVPPPEVAAPSASVQLPTAVSSSPAGPFAVPPPPAQPAARAPARRGRVGLVLALFVVLAGAAAIALVVLPRRREPAAATRNDDVVVMPPAPAVVDAGSAAGPAREVAAAEDTPREPEDTPREPEDTPREPEDTPREPEDTPREPADTPREPDTDGAGPADAAAVPESEAGSEDTAGERAPRLEHSGSHAPPRKAKPERASKAKPTSTARTVARSERESEPSRDPAFAGSAARDAAATSSAASAASQQGSAAPAVLTANAPAPGTVDAGAVRAVVRAHLAEIQECVSRARMDNRDLKGRITMRIALSATGAVTATSVASSTGATPGLEACMRKVVSGWTFPAPAGGVPAAIRYPFAF